MGLACHLYPNLNLADTVTLTLDGGEVCIEGLPLTPDAPNQDSVAVLDGGDAGALLVLADGMGGGPDGDRASALAVEAVVEQTARALADDRPLRGGVLDGFEAAQRALAERGGGAATTLLAVEILNGAVRTYHAGDSAACVFGRGGKLKLLTDMHSPVGYAQKSGLLDEREALLHKERHLVSNIVGLADMSVQVGSPLRLARYDTVVLASDGVFDNLLLAEIGERVRRGPLAAAARQLRDDALKRMRGRPTVRLPSKPDDLSLVVFRRGG